MLGLFRSRPPLTETRTFVDVLHGGERYRVALKRVARARRFTLRVRAATQDAVLTMPTASTLAAAKAFAHRHAAWVGERMLALPRRHAFAIGSSVPFEGDDIPILTSSGLRAAAFLDRAIRPDGSEGAVLRVAGTAAEQHRRVLVFLQSRAREALMAAAARHAAAVGRAVRSVTLRDTRSRWGSCSSSGRLNFSWRLILAPPFVLDYLAAHEVAHLVHLDHSPAFWAVTQSLVPDYHRAEAWLRAHGASLHRFGAPADVSAG